MKKQQDFLDECMGDTGIKNASVEQFQMAFCQRCLNTACVRSKANELLWSKRMDRQLTALYDPSFGDMRDPKNLILSKQDFRTLDTSVIRVGSWEPPKKVVHHADPPSETHTSNKVDQSLSSLEMARGKDVTVTSTPVNKDPEPQVPVESSPPKILEEPSAESAPIGNPYNTQVPVEGLSLAPQHTLPPTPPKKDTWAVSGKKERIVVNLGSGDVKKIPK